MTQVHVTMYKGWEVEISDFDGRLTATDIRPQGGQTRPEQVTIHGETLEKLKKSIDTRENRKKKAATVSTYLPVVSPRGEGAITGISLHDDSYLGAPDHHWEDLYVDTPWVRAQLARITALEEEVKRLESNLAVAAIAPISSGWNRKVGISVKHDGDYAEAIADLKARYTKALLAAEEIAEKESEGANRR